MSWHFGGTFLLSRTPRGAVDRTQLNRCDHLPEIKSAFPSRTPVEGTRPDFGLRRWRMRRSAARGARRAASRSRAGERDQSVTIAAPAKRSGASSPRCAWYAGRGRASSNVDSYAWRAVQRRDSDRPTGLRPGEAWRRALLLLPPSGASPGGLQIEALVLRCLSERKRSERASAWING